MIAILISDTSKTETQCIVRFTKEYAARYTEEYWKMLTCSNIQELKKVVDEKIKLNIICVDITMDGALDLTKELRILSPSAYMILIASTSMSPITYMRPSIGAESLMLKPLTQQQIQEILKEALDAYTRRFYQRDEKRMFVIEYKGERELVDYESIFFFEAREKKVFLNTDTEEYGFYGTLDELEEKLKDAFVRCHRSFLVNKRKVVKVYLSQNRIELVGGFEIPLSRSYKPVMKEYFGRREVL